MRRREQSGMPSIEEMVSGLAKRLESNPEDGTGWMMLGRSYTVLGRLKEAESALEKSVQLLPDEPDALAAYAEFSVGETTTTFAANPQNC